MTVNTDMLYTTRYTIPPFSHFWVYKCLCSVRLSLKYIFFGEEYCGTLIDRHIIYGVLVTLDYFYSI